MSFPSIAPVIAPPPMVVQSSDSLPPILVADDDPDDRFFIRRLIGKTGTEHPVRTFDDGTEVVNYLGAIAAGGPEVRRRAPRLLFLDLRMAGLGGFGFLEWARQQKGALPLTIVVLSNSVEPADVSRALALGAHRYLVKYPSVQTFSTIVRSIHPFTLAH
ncbi:MAG TPA: response regulator [Opitutaceae bacterium]|nr:response regulator [Opitutaceae bacterium]